MGKYYFNFDSLVGLDTQQVPKLDLIWFQFLSILRDLLKINKQLIRTGVSIFTTRVLSKMIALITNTEAKLHFFSQWALPEISFSSQAKIN